MNLNHVFGSSKRLWEMIADFLDVPALFALSRVARAFKGARARAIQRKYGDEWMVTIRGTSMTTVPREVYGFAALFDLHIVHNNMLKELPREFGRLTNLRLLVLANNQLASLPREIGCLTQLWCLNVANNVLATLPRTLWQLTRLEALVMSGNPLRSLPVELTQLTELRDLSVPSKLSARAAALTGDRVRIH